MQSSNASWVFFIYFLLEGWCQFISDVAEIDHQADSGCSGRNQLSKTHLLQYGLNLAVWASLKHCYCSPPGLLPVTTHMTLALKEQSHCDDTPRKNSENFYLHLEVCFVAHCWKQQERLCKKTNSSICLQITALIQVVMRHCAAPRLFDEVPTVISTKCGSFFFFKSVKLCVCTAVKDVQSSTWPTHRTLSPVLLVLNQHINLLFIYTWDTDCS